VSRPLLTPPGPHRARPLRNENYRFYCASLGPAVWQVALLHQQRCDVPLGCGRPTRNPCARRSRLDQQLSATRSASLAHNPQPEVVAEATAERTIAPESASAASAEMNGRSTLDLIEGKPQSDKEVRSSPSRSRRGKSYADLVQAVKSFRRGAAMATPSCNLEGRRLGSTLKLARARATISRASGPRLLRGETLIEHETSMAVLQPLQSCPSAASITTPSAGG